MTDKHAPTPETTTLTIPLLEHERWWGGNVADGRLMPYGKEPFARDLSSWKHHPDLDEASNQSSPLLVSTKGRYVWSRNPFEFSFADGTLLVKGSQLISGETGGSLRDAYKEACLRFFPPSHRTPALEMVTKPQYNTWIEMPYRPTQEKVLAYAQGMLDAGMPAGVLMIDDMWSPDYGDWTFDTAKFPNPRQMLDTLHDWGFNVMLWLVPFVSPDSPTFRRLEARNLLLKDKNGRIAIRRWWNGLSAVLDLSNPDTHDWIHEQLDALLAMGVDGFKFDGADLYDFHPDDRPLHPMNSNDMCEQWAHIGSAYPFNEFRACWKMGAQPLAQRLQDKPPVWNEYGIGSLIPEMLAQGMIGHAFSCPDMIGGGEVNSTNHDGVDQEFFVRYAQIAALSPMMQFSIAPSRVLDDVHLHAVREALRIRESLLPTIVDLARQAAATGEPIIRPMSYQNGDLEDITDQFMLGNEIIVAPATARGATSRTIAIPDGIWRSDLGEIVRGPATVEVDTPIDRIPRFHKME